jgi:hypothetical protein
MNNECLLSACFASYMGRGGCMRNTSLLHRKSLSLKKIMKDANRYMFEKI